MFTLSGDKILTINFQVCAENLRNFETEITKMETLVT